MTPTDRIRSRTVQNYHTLIQEHLESMQRDSHGLEFSRWKQEVDGLWQHVFRQIGAMKPGPQRSSLEMIRGLWTTYLAHYGVVGE